MTTAQVPPQQPLSGSLSQAKQRQAELQPRKRQAQTTQQRPGAAPGAAEKRPEGLSVTPIMADGARAFRVLPASVLDATTSKLVLPSRGAVYALLALPLVLWVACVLLGIAHGEPLPDGLAKHEFEHPLLAFDRYVFRVWGPLLPLAPLLLRWAALGLPGPARATSALSSVARKLTGGNNEVVLPSGVALPPAPTLPLQALGVYLVVIVLRVSLYAGHLAWQLSPAAALMSDHLLLAASVVACFQAELVLCMSDVVKVELLRTYDPGQGSGVRQAVVCSALVASMFLLVFLFADMYCTARWYHHAAESAGALLAGSLLFNLPVTAWVLSKAKRTAE